MNAIDLTLTFVQFALCLCVKCDVFTPYTHYSACSCVFSMSLSLGLCLSVCLCMCVYGRVCVLADGLSPGQPNHCQAVRAVILASQLSTTDKDVK